MTHAQSLRVIGQSLQTARVTTFELEKNGPEYLVRTNSLSLNAEWILRQATSESDFTKQSGKQPAANRPLRFTPTAISQLDSLGQQERRKPSASQTQEVNKLSQLLRSLGDHLDRTEVSVFHVLWDSDSVSVDFRLSDGQNDSRTFTTEKLQQLGSHSRFLRSSRFR
jgi:hypothetical protein